MTKIIKRKLYCESCKKYYEVPVVLSTNSYMIKNDPALRRKAIEGTLFKNFCPDCGKELVNKDDE
jgi:hypothetical protein